MVINYNLRKHWIRSKYLFIVSVADLAHLTQVQGGAVEDRKAPQWECACLNHADINFQSVSDITEPPKDVLPKRSEGWNCESKPLNNVLVFPRRNKKKEKKRKTQIIRIFQ